MEEDLKEIGGLLKDDWQCILNILAASQYRLDGVKQLAKLVTVIEGNLSKLGSTNEPMETLPEENITNPEPEAPVAEETPAIEETVTEPTPDQTPVEEQPQDQPVTEPTPETPVDNPDVTQ